MNPTQQFPQLTSIGRVTTPYGAQTEEEGAHPGVDVANKKGTPIPAFAGGTVMQTINGRKQGENNFGNSVVIKDPAGDVHRYSHLNTINVQPGQNVPAGKEIGTMGATGAAYSPSGGDASNLDYRVVNAYGQYIDPMKYVK